MRGEALCGKKSIANLVVLMLSFLILLTGCQSPDTLTEPEPPDPENDLQKTEALDPNIILSLLFAAGDFILSPDENLLYFIVPSDPGTLYHTIDLSEVDIDSPTAPEIEWDAIEALDTPSIMGNTYHLQVSDDSKNLLYATSEIQWDETDYGAKTVIYFSRPEFPPKVYHQLELTGGEVPYATFAGPDISPAWEPGTNNIIYLTLSGVYRYSTDDRKKTLIRPAADLPGMAGEEQLVPHAFYLENDHKELAYYVNNTIYLVSLVDGSGKTETIEIEPGENDYVGLQYIFGGSYLVLEDSYTGWGFGLDYLELTFLDRQSGKVVLEGNDYLPAGYILDENGQMFFKSRGADNEGSFVLLNSSLSEISRISAKGMIPAEEFFYQVNVIKLKDCWAIPFYLDMDTHFAEIYFD